MFAKNPLLGLAAVCLALTACNFDFDGAPMPGPDEAPADEAEGAHDPAAPCDAEPEEPAEEPAEEPEQPAEEPEEPAEEPEEPAEEPEEPAERPADVCGPFAAPAVEQADVQLLPPLPAVGPDCDVVLGPVRPDRHGPYPASIPLPDACGRASNYTNAGAADDSPYEVHVIGVYEGGIDLPGVVGIGATEVIVERTAKPVVLVLSAYDSVRWRLRPAPDARIAGVILTGYHDQRIEGSPVPVQRLDYDYFCESGYGWEVRHNTGGGDQPAMMRGIRAALGQAETSFQGCYGGARFTVPYAECPETEAPALDPLDEAIDPADVDLGVCDFITEESLYCATHSGRGLELLGLDTGSRCVLGPADGNWQSLSWLGEAIYGCDESGVKRFRVDTGTWETLEVPCESLAVDGGDLLVSVLNRRGDLDIILNGGIFRFDGAAGLLDGQLIEQFGPHAPGQRLDADGGILYTAWHSTDRVERFDMAQGVELPPVMLEDYDDWIFGMDVIDGRIVVIGPEGVYIFDADDGSRLLGIPALNRAPMYGLACAGAAQPAP